MPLFFEQRTGAQIILGVTAVIAVVAESWATYAGDGSVDGSRWRRAARSASATVLVRNRRAGVTSDEGTKRILIGGTILGLLAMIWLTERFPGVRAGSDDWFGVCVGAALALSGIAWRVWAVHTLGRFFEREVVVEADQTLVRSGPYRWIRHPAYAGNLLTWFGIGVAIGSWIAAALGTAIILLSLLPRIRVEERVLSQAFGTDYDQRSAPYRLIPGVW
jgi:protein-S-isoprenylcysteine O-methyltransferase